MKTNFDYDVIVVGSGFGGSVMSLRLVEKGYHVCLLERGQRWGMLEFPRRIHEIREKMFWDTEDQKYGLMEMRDYEDSDVMTVSASGLGGGSLIYANVLMPMPEENFKDWPGGISRQKLDPYYDRVLKMLEASPYPLSEDEYYSNTPKAQAFKKLGNQLNAAADATGRPEYLRPNLAIRFKGDFPGHQTTNIHGAIQSKCTKCGECDLGCNIHAKNTLDLNYLFRAQNNKDLKHPLEIKTHSEVALIRPDQDGYLVQYFDPRNPSDVKTLRSKRVVLSAGSLGSTELLLKMKKAKHLPELNRWLGKKWCGNGDLEGTVLDSDQFLDPTNGPVITSAIHYPYSAYPDGFAHTCYIQDAGFPIGMAWYLSGKVPQPKSLLHQLALGWHYVRNFILKIFGKSRPRGEDNIGNYFAQAIDAGDFVNRAMVLLGMGRDRSTGEVVLNRENKAVVRWDLAPSELHYQRVRNEMSKIAEGLGGKFLENPLSQFEKVIAVHPIGGCPMGDSNETGFVSTHGEVFHYPGLYVVDASIIPTSLGPNPSLTIAALAEMIADQWGQK
ncbi:MAG: cholesterol oxidase [Oligoflexia bacterium]|nr:MAG: cholesterol oxidase [Oligoflexia bacterium]